MSITYEGIVFKNPPAEDMAKYPYMFLYISSSANYKYRLTMSDSKYYYQSSDDTLQPGSTNVKNYWMTDAMAQSSSEWELRNTTAYYWQEVSTRVYSANYNIPIGSASGTEYFLRHNIDLPTLLNQFQNSSGNGLTSCTLSMSGCEVGNLLVAAYAVRGASNVVTLSDGWKALGGGNQVSTPSSANQQRVFFASKIAESTTETLTVTQTGTARIYMIAAEFYGVVSAEIQNDVSNTGLTNATVTTEKPGPESVMFYAVSSVYYTSDRLQTAAPNDLVKVQGDSSAERLAGWFDFGGGALSHTFQTYPTTNPYDAIVEAVELFPEKISYHTTGHADYLVTGADRVHSSTDSNISWTFEAPEGTACDVLVKIGDGDFLAAENGGKIPGLVDGTDLSGTPLTVRVALSTENSEVTPVFHALSLWIADEDDKNVISLHFPEGNQNSVQNAIAPISVAYSGATLAGDGGFVQAFEVMCPINGLEYKGDQHDVEHIEITSMQSTGILKQIYYREPSGGAEHIDIGNIVTTGVLTYVDDI